MRQMKRKCGSGDLLASKSSERLRLQFLANVTQKNGCWVFGINSDQQKHAHFKIDGYTMSAHRFSKIIHHGKPSRPELFACHTCMTKRCVNPSHLVWQTAKENAHDMIRDGTFVPRNNFAKFSKLSKDKARTIFQMYHQGMVSSGDLAEKFKVSRNSVHAIASGLTYKSATVGLQKRPVPSDGKTIRRGMQHKNAKLTDMTVLEIRRKLLDGVAFISIQKQYGLTASGIMAIKSGRTWKHLLPDNKDERQKYLDQFKVVKSPRNKLTTQEKTEIIRMLSEGNTQKNVASLFGVSKGLISLILKRANTSELVK